MHYALPNEDLAIVHGGAVCEHASLVEGDAGTLYEQKSSLAERSWKNTPGSGCEDVGCFRCGMKIVNGPVLSASDTSGDKMNSTTQNKKVPIHVIREERLLFLQDEVETLKDRNSWLEDELEEANAVIYRLEHGLPVSFKEEI
jgi:hypothetical protein